MSEFIRQSSTKKFRFSFSFVQVFIDNPLLIDGHAFDFGIYVLVTSIDPLLIYRWTRDVFIRFCPEPYHPFDPTNVNKYVVQDNHKPYWEMPSLKAAVDKLNFSAYDAFAYHLESQGHDVDSLWTQVDDAIVSITLSKLSHLDRYWKTFQKKTEVNAFELLRFDFIIDDQMQIHLMEVNMSPNLTPASERDERHSVMYEQLVYRTVSMLGMSYSEIKMRFY